MPKYPFRRNLSSFLRYLFPHTRTRARAQLSRFRHETLPSYKHRTQAQIYKYIVYRQALKLGRKPGILRRLRGRTRKLLGTNYLENEARLRRQKLTQSPGAVESSKRAMSYQDSDGGRQPGARRKKLAGYLKAANEMRQSYTEQYAPGFSRRDAAYEYEDDTPGSFTDAAVVRSGEEEMILFPSYARKHVKKKVNMTSTGTVSLADPPSRKQNQAPYKKQQATAATCETRAELEMPNSGNSSGTTTRTTMLLWMWMSEDGSTRRTKDRCQENRGYSSVSHGSSSEYKHHLLAQDLRARP